MPQIVEVKLFSEQVKVIDISRGGLLMACNVRLLPSREVRLKIVGVNQSIWVPSRIVRCQVATLSKERVVYLTAVTFNTPLDWLDDRPELDEQLEAMSHPQDEAAAADEPAAADESISSELDQAFLLNNW